MLSSDLVHSEENCVSLHYLVLRIKIEELANLLSAWQPLQHRLPAGVEEKFFIISELAVS